MVKFVQEIEHTAILMEDLLSPQMWRYVITLHMGWCVALDGVMLKQKYCASRRDIILQTMVNDFKMQRASFRLDY